MPRTGDGALLVSALASAPDFLRGGTSTLRSAPSARDTPGSLAASAGRGATSTLRGGGEVTCFAFLPSAGDCAGGLASWRPPNTSAEHWLFLAWHELMHASCASLATFSTQALMQTP